MLRALETFHAPHVSIVAGEEVADDHPVVAGREHLFEKLPDAEDRKPAAPRRKPR